MGKEHESLAHIDFLSSLGQTISGATYSKSETASSSRRLHDLHIGFIYDPDSRTGEKVVIMQERHVSEPSPLQKRTLRLTLSANDIRQTAYLTSQNLPAELRGYRIKLDQRANQKTTALSQPPDADIHDLLS